MPAPPPPELLPLGIYLLAVPLLVAGLLAASHFLGERRTAHPGDAPFESGIVGVGLGRGRLRADFYLVALFFVIFDVEAAFLFAWAIALREAGWPGFAEAALFVAILLAALAYLWRLGGLDWGPRRATESTGEASEENADAL